MELFLPELGVGDVSIDAGATGILLRSPANLHSRAHRITAEGTGHRISKEAPVP
jgi:hypothetical protein